MILKIKRKTAKSGNTYIALFREKNEKEIFITFDPSTMCRLSGLCWQDIKELKVGEEIII